MFPYDHPISHTFIVRLKLFNEKSYMITLNYRFLYVVDKHLFNSHNDLSFSNFSHDKPNEKVFVNFTLFFQSIMTFCKRKGRRNHPYWPQIRNLVEMST